MKNQDTVLKTHLFIFGETKGRDSLMLTTEFIANGDEITADTGVFLNQELTLQSYNNSASFNLYGTILTPKSLRQLANELEIERNKLIK